MVKIGRNHIRSTISWIAGGIALVLLGSSFLFLDDSSPTGYRNSWIMFEAQPLNSQSFSPHNHAVDLIASGLSTSHFNSYSNNILYFRHVLQLRVIDILGAV
jgi:hypothetical protein